MFQNSMRELTIIFSNWGNLQKVIICSVVQSRQGTLIQTSVKFNQFWEQNVKRIMLLKFVQSFSKQFLFTEFYPQSKDKNHGLVFIKYLTFSQCFFLIKTQRLSCLTGQALSICPDLSKKNWWIDILTNLPYILIDMHKQRISYCCKNHILKFIPPHPEMSTGCPVCSLTATDAKSRRQDLQAREGPSSWLECHIQATSIHSLWLKDGRK